MIGLRITGTLLQATSTIRLYADRKGWPLTRVEVAVRHQRASLKARDRFEIDVRLEGPLDEAQRARLMEIAEHCPVHLTLARGADMQNKLLPLAAPVPGPLEGPAHLQCMEEACAY